MKEVSQLKHTSLRLSRWPKTNVKKCPPPKKSTHFSQTWRKALEEQLELHRPGHYPLLLQQDLRHSRPHPLTSPPRTSFLIQRDERCWDVLLCFMHSRWDLSQLPPPIRASRTMCSAELLWRNEFHPLTTKREVGSGMVKKTTKSTHFRHFDF